MKVDSTNQCIVCDGRLNLFGPRLNFEYHICSACGTIQLCPMPTQSELREAYQHKYSFANQAEEFCDPGRWKSVARTYHQSLLAALVDHQVSGLIVDFGAGWGHLCEMLNKNGFNCVGLELSEAMVAYCKQREIPVRMGSLELLQGSEGKVSSLVMCAVFEHLTEYHDWLNHANRLLSDGGYLISLQPTAACYNLLGSLARLGNRHKELPEFHGTFSPPWHVALFTIKGMHILAQKHGFQLMDVRRAPQGRIGGLLGCVQVSLEMINRLGWRILETKWPLVTSHIFVMRKVPDSNGANSEHRAGAEKR